MPKKKAEVRKDKSAQKSKKKKYKVRNWHEYNDSLVRRGSLDFWVEQGIIKKWEVKIIPEKRTRGGQTEYSDEAIETTSMIGKVYHQRLRQTEGMVRSIFAQIGWSLPVPDYSTLSRRGVDLKVNLPVQPKDRVVAIIDSTGLKVYGEGEWKVRQHGVSKRRSWVKMHISIDEDGEVRAALCTDQSVDDAQGGMDLLTQQTGDQIAEFLGDGAYDKQKIYRICDTRQINTVLIPPRKDAKIWFHGNRAGPPHLRDENLRLMRKLSRQRWKDLTGYHRRSKVETTMYRRKVIFGDRLQARRTENQITEVMLTLKALNLMLYAGKPDSYAVG